MIGIERCSTSRRTSVLMAACAGGVVVAGVAVVLGLATGEEAKLVPLSVAGLVLVSAILLGWFAVVRSLDDPKVRAVTSERAVVVTRAGEVRAIPLSRVTRIRAVRATPGGRTPAGEEGGAPTTDTEDWASAVGLEIESRDGRRFSMVHADMRTIGPEVVRVVEERTSRSV